MNCISVQGCADFATQSHLWVTRSGDEATVGCKDTNLTWHLKCKNSEWIGNIQNCGLQGLLIT